MKSSPVYFIIGYSGVGKTTLGFMLRDYLVKKGSPTFVLDNNDMQDFKITSAFGGMDIDSRYKRAVQVTNLIKWIQNQEIITIVPAIGQPAKARESWARNIDGYTEIYLKASIDVCKKRDNKDIYNTNEVRPNIIGVDIPYEEPENSHIVLDAENHTPEELLSQFIKKLCI